MADNEVYLESAEDEIIDEGQVERSDQQVSILKAIKILFQKWVHTVQNDSNTQTSSVIYLYIFNFLTLENTEIRIEIRINDLGVKTLVTPSSTLFKH